MSHRCLCAILYQRKTSSPYMLQVVCYTTVRDNSPAVYSTAPAAAAILKRILYWPSKYPCAAMEATRRGMTRQAGSGSVHAVAVRTPVSPPPVLIVELTLEMPANNNTAAGEGQMSVKIQADEHPCAHQTGQDRSKHPSARNERVCSARQCSRAIVDCGHADRHCPQRYTQEADSEAGVMLRGSRDANTFNVHSRDREHGSSCVAAYLAGLCTSCSGLQSTLAMTANGTDSARQVSRTRAMI